jgi:hypothetical protein
MQLQGTGEKRQGREGFRAGTGALAMLRSGNVRADRRDASSERQVEQRRRGYSKPSVFIFFQRVFRLIPRI